jgi:Acetoacetate decarboxylase (ADC)
MPRNGLLDLGPALQAAPHVLSTSAPSWDISDARLVQVNWEIADEPALELTPPGCHPSIPPFASFFAGRYPDTPVGTFQLAQARIVIRAGIRPRAFCLGAVCDNAEAVEALRSNWGYPVVLGEVEVSVRHDRTRVGAAVGGRDVLEIVLPTPEVIGGNDLMTFDNLHLVRLGEPPEGAILQIDPEYAVHKADRAVPRLHLPDPEALGMRGRLRLGSPITGFSILADTDLVPVRFLMDPTKPATQGTRRIDRAA